MPTSCSELSVRRRRWSRLFALLILSVAVVACGETAPEGPSDGPIADPYDSEAPLSSAEALLDGAPGNDALPEEGKFDAVYPAQFDLVATQSPVKSQGSRGVCSIFSTTALMEHLYIKEGTLTTPDFSEQFLQWSAKAEVGSFTTTSGSNAQSNLQAISRFGVVQEADWPYEPSPWGTSKDERCTGDSQPRECHTNGEPPASALSATRWKLPPGRYVNSRVRSIKAFLSENETAVVAGMDFFYQSWNHRGSSLPVNSGYWSEGYILYPNDVDKQKSLEKRAGHSILIVGWDDELEVPRVDEKGEVIVDANGDPVTEKGFFLIKNSWGTSGFGIRNKFGAGYGWLSYKYVEEHASVYGSAPPKLELVETCDDGLDNDFDGQIDCADAACAAELACNTTGLRFDNRESTPIPDGDATGIGTVIQVEQSGTVGKVTVDLDITHSYRGDLTVSLVAPDGTRAPIHARSGGSADDLKGTFTLDAFAGKSLAGPWTLEVADGAGGDTGRLNGWTLVFELSGDVPPEVCGDGIDNDGSGTTDCADTACAADALCAAAGRIELDNTTGLAIPDGGAPVESLIAVTESGRITGLAVSVDITHTFRPDLTVKLRHPSGAEAVLFDRAEELEQNLVRRFTVTDFDGLGVTGDWALVLQDTSSFDEGRLNSWSLEIDTVGE